jgi:hypothetical protein
MVDQIPGLENLDMDLKYLENGLTEVGIKVTHYEHSRKIDAYQQTGPTSFQSEINTLVKDSFVDKEDPYFQKIARKMGIDFSTETRKKLYENPTVDVEIFGNGKGSIGKYTLSLEKYKSIIQDTLTYVNNHCNPLARLNYKLVSCAHSNVFEKLKKGIMVKTIISEKRIWGSVKSRTEIVTMSSVGISEFGIEKINQLLEKGEDSILLYDGQWTPTSTFKQRMEKLYISKKEAHIIVDAYKKELNKLRERENVKVILGLFKDYMKERVILLVKQKLESRIFETENFTGKGVD